MKASRPEVLAVRAVNQYRRREAFSYFGLRYYLENRAARRDRWANGVATHLVSTRVTLPYLPVHHFKEFSPAIGGAVRRLLHLPGANEAVAEASLLHQCARAGGPFDRKSCVFSYELAEHGRDGMFKPYFEGFRARHHAIAKRCRGDRAATVMYTDIRKFYPSIRHSSCKMSWEKACKEAALPKEYRELGLKLLDDHGSVAKRGSAKALLTGPMFSHLIANLVLQKVDARMQDFMPGGYFRYVDDIVLVGGESDVQKTRSVLLEELEKEELELHDGSKDFVVSADRWMVGEGDFKEPDGIVTWKTLVGSLKQLLVKQPDKRNAIVRVFSENGIRLPVPDYSEAVWEGSYISRLFDSGYAIWFRRKAAVISPESLLDAALELRRRFSESVKILAEKVRDADEYDRRRLLPKLRYYSGRLFYLAERNSCRILSEWVEQVPELYYQAKVFECLDNWDVTKLLPLGTNAVQAAAQPLRMMTKEVVCRSIHWNEAAIQGAATLALYGLRLRTEVKPERAELLRFAEWEEDGTELMESHDDAIRELACLHGVGSRRHEEFLDLAFDTDEEIQFDALNQLEAASLSF